MFLTSLNNKKQTTTKSLLCQSLFNDCIHDQIAEISLRAGNSISDKDKKRYGAFYTPKALSMHMVNVANFSGGLLADQGAGSGILSALALVKYINNNNGRSASLEAYEIQNAIHPYLTETMQTVVGYGNDLGVSDISCNLNHDYLLRAEAILKSDHGECDNGIQNPPYYKLGKSEPLNSLFLSLLGFTVPNIYIAFVILALKELKPNGTLTTLIPRSFMNGRYFKNARRYIKSIACLESVTRFRSRSNLFKGDNVLQENVICHFRRGAQCELIKIYTCDEPEIAPAVEMDIEASLLLNNPNDLFILPADTEELAAFKKVTSHAMSLDELGVGVSTGKVILNRVTGVNTESKGALLIEGKSFDSKQNLYTRKDNADLPNAIEVTEKIKPMLVNAEPRILIKRISSNSDNKRMHVTALLPKHSNFEPVALSNHVQYLYGLNKPLAEREVHFLTDYLRSKDVELAMRCLSGTTQINVDDLSILRFPSLAHE